MQIYNTYSGAQAFAYFCRIYIDNDKNNNKNIQFIGQS